MVVKPTSASVQGNALAIVCATVSFGNEYETPNLNWAVFLRYSQYCVTGLPCGTPSWTSMACR
jgi:hypothetical protein